MADNRFFPMNWVPRWCNAYYSTDSILRKIYFLGLYYYTDLMKQVLKGSFTPNFYGEVGTDRYLFIAKYHYPQTYIPHITLQVTGNAASTIVKAVDSMSSLFYELTSPVYYRGSDLLYFKNLDIRSVAVTATSGIINLTTIIAQEALEPDSPIIIENSWGDQRYIDQTNSSYSAVSGTIRVPYDGTYTVYYRSNIRLNSLLNSISYIRIDGEIISIYQHYVDNVWDYFADYLALFRNKSETNNQLKTRSQHMTVASRPNQRIAAALGLAVSITWYTSGATINTSGYNDWQFQGFTRSFYVREVPIKDGNNFILTYAPTGYVQVFLDGNKINESAYTVSGSYLIAGSTLLEQASEGNIEVSYKHQRMRERHYPENENLTAIEADGLLYRGILIKDDILVKNVTRRIEDQEWRWNKEQGLLNGSADFDF